MPRSAYRATRVLLAAGLALLPLASACDGAATVAPAEARAVRFVLAESRPFEEGPAGPCDVPLSGWYELHDGTWRSEFHWDAACLGEGPAGEVRTFTFSGPFTLRGDTIDLRSSDPDDLEAVSGLLAGDSLVVWGHCEGEDRFVRR